MIWSTCLSVRCRNKEHSITTSTLSKRQCFFVQEYLNSFLCLVQPKRKQHEPSSLYSSSCSVIITQVKYWYSFANFCLNSASFFKCKKRTLPTFTSLWELSYIFLCIKPKQTHVWCISCLLYHNKWDIMIFNNILSQCFWVINKPALYSGHQGLVEDTTLHDLPLN